MTSNIGSNEIQVGFNQKNDDIISKLKEYLDVSLIGRIDNIVQFDNLSEEQIKNIIKNKIKKLKTKYKNKNINVNISSNVINEICDESDYELMGARKIDKIIKDRLDNQIIDEIINNNSSITIKTIKLTV